jgi:hypothetical protein
VSGKKKRSQHDMFFFFFKVKKPLRLRVSRDTDFVIVKWLLYVCKFDHIDIHIFTAGKSRMNGQHG